MLPMSGGTIKQRYGVSFLSKNEYTPPLIYRILLVAVNPPSPLLVARHYCLSPATMSSLKPYVYDWNLVTTTPQCKFARFYNGNNEELTISISDSEPLRVKTSTGHRVVTNLVSVRYYYYSKWIERIFEYLYDPEFDVSLVRREPDEPDGTDSPDELDETPEYIARTLNIPKFAEAYSVFLKTR